MNEKFLKEVKDRYTLPYGEEYPTADALDIGMDVDALLTILESIQQQLKEAQQTIRMAYSDLPDKKYDAEATLEGYMTRHNLEEW